ncbi:EF-hand domain-containing protein [Acidovorax cavernicola]|uniref:EF-hand domain-containing protein n=1 Tax=Acidovorax cavernicola TaxID=1675792 RepID=A0A9X8D7C4_9BURK|nr:EF-hand domain-containing protein [Acidovorax cavernicola]RIX83184.1 EF-hand domain-containing protein [Acidovorax cavernicola]
MKKIALLTLFAAVSALAAMPDQKQTYIDKTFASMDTNGDGRVDKTEYTSFQQSRFKNRAQAVDAAFEELDKDKDGKISKAEAIVVPEISRYFDGLDADKDGVLSREEMQRAMIAAQTAESPEK